MSPTDFTDSHRLFVRVCLNLPQISQILTDCLWAFVLIFYDFTDSVFFGGFPYLCKSVQSVGAFCRMQSVGTFCRVQSVEPFCRMQSVGETLYLE